jgi:ABC-type lipoprotein release transport system permease subunit
MYEIFDLDIYTYGLYFDDVNSSYEVLTYADKNMFSMVLTETYGLSLIRRAVEVFEDLVNLIIVMMFIVTIIFLIMVGKKNINNNLHEIGVLKSLGAKHKDISNLFTLQSFANGILIILESIVGMILGAYVANMVIITSFNSIFKTTIENLTLVQAYPNLMANVLVIAMVIVVISSLFNIRTLKKLKPIAVLKAKE